jgi:hypothetical protein
MKNREIKEYVFHIIFSYILPTYLFYAFSHSIFFSGYLTT